MRAHLNLFSPSFLKLWIIPFFLNLSIALGLTTALLSFGFIPKDTWDFIFFISFLLILSVPIGNLFGFYINESISPQKLKLREDVIKDENVFLNDVFSPFSKEACKH